MKMAVLALVLAAVPGNVGAQSQGAPPTPNIATSLGSGWTAIGAGQPQRALQVARQLLQVNPRNHDAIALAIAALAATAEPIPALDEYERWLTQSRLEDPLLVQPIALATLDQISHSKDAVQALASVEQLAAAGVGGAQERLQTARNAENALAVDAALLRLGDRSAAARVIQNAETGKRGSAATAEILTVAGSASIPALQRMLTDPAGPTRAAAARALGKLEARTALPSVKAKMTDPDPLVRARAAVALARMGDSEGEEQAAEMLKSPVADMRLIAAEAYADRGNGPWVAAILPLLKDPAGLTRLMAAELVAAVEPEAARGVLAQAADDPNPVVRAEAIRMLATASITSLGSADWPALRRWLRDPEAGIRLHAAIIILDLTSSFLRP